MFSKAGIGVSTTILVVLLASLSESDRAQAPTGSGMEEVHISVQLRQLSGDPVDDLTASAFEVSIGSQTFPVTVTRPAQGRKTPPRSSPTRLLLIFSPAVMPRSKTSAPPALERLNAVWSRGWQVAVLTPEGVLTPWASNAVELRTSLLVGSGQKRSYEEVLTVAQQIDGRSVVVYLGGDRSEIPPGLRNAARRTHVLLYHVGGDVFRNYNFSGAERTSTSLPVYGATLDGFSPGPPDGGFTVVNDVETYTAIATQSIGDVHVERTFQGAIRDAIRDRRNFYDLSLFAPRGTPVLGLRMKVAGDYQINALPYLIGEGSAPELVLNPKP